MRAISTAIAALSIGMLAASAQAGVVESFDTGAFGPGWAYTDTGTITAEAAHDGGFGLRLTQSGGNAGHWNYNTAISVSEGDVLSMWVRLHDEGRVYFGFGSNATNSQSLVAAANTDELMFQDNANYDHYSVIGSNAFAWTLDKWYRLEIDWMAGGNAVGKVFDSDGTTLLDSLSQSGLALSSGGIALRAFFTVDIDTITVNSAGTVPEPASIGLVALGLLGAAGAARRRG